MGEHIRRRRRELGLTLRAARKDLGVSPYTLANWEKGKTAPVIIHMPGILQFLGYDPFPTPETLAERMLAKRRVMGWTIEEAARQFGVDEGTWSDWESTGHVPWRRFLIVLEAMLQPGQC